VKKDLLGESVAGLKKALLEYKPVVLILRRQQKDGSWKYSGGKKYVRLQRNYNQLETYRILGQLVEKYGLTRKDPAVREAADFLFSFQTKEGDLRGIYRNQYSPNYTAAIMELLIKAGYDEDLHIKKGFKWLLSIRQADRGWAIPMRTNPATKDRLRDAFVSKKPVQPDKSKPFSHCITGVVLRAFAAHPKWRKSKEAKQAGKLLASRFFQTDKYPDRRMPSFWKKLTFPFWHTDILSSLDSLSLIGFKKEHPQIKKGLDWLIKKQSKDGLWRSGYPQAKEREIDLWVTLAAARVVKRFYS
jgi:hypothetical protein